MGALVFDPLTKSPNYPSLDAATPETVGRYLSSRNFTRSDERVVRIDQLGSASRNQILRVVTAERRFVIKHFRAWPAGDCPAPGPEERFRAETRFYRSARIAGCARAALPEVLHHDAQAGCIILEDAGAALPLSGRAIAPDVAAKLGWFLVSLHHHSRSVPACAHYRNEQVVGWQMARLFRVSDMNRRGAGATWLARWRERSREVRYALEDALAALERGGASLVHGDYSPANWVQSGHGPRVVDGEFSFFGPPEFDAGTYLAGLLLERQGAASMRAAVDVIARGSFRYDLRLVAAYAGVQLCDGLGRVPGPGGATRLRGSAMSALLRRVQAVIERGTLDALLGDSS